MAIHHILYSLFCVQTLAASDNSLEYESNDRFGKIEVGLSAFQIRIFHPWVLDDFLTDGMVDAVRVTVQDVLHGAFDAHFLGAAQMSFANVRNQSEGKDHLQARVDGVELKTIKIDRKGRQNKRQRRRNAMQTSIFQAPVPPSCPCSDVALGGMVVFILEEPSSSALTFAERDVISGDQPIIETAYLDGLVRSWLRHGGSRSDAMEFVISHALSQLSKELPDGQKPSARLIFSISDSRGSDASPLLPSTDKQDTNLSTRSPTVSPTFETIRSEAISDAIFDRTILLSGAVAGTVFLSFGLFFLLKANRRKSDTFHDIFVDNQGSEREQFDFNPTQESKSLPPKVREREVKRRCYPTLRLGSDFLFDDGHIKRDRGQSHDVQWSCDLSAPSQSFEMDPARIELYDVEQQKKTSLGSFVDAPSDLTKTSRVRFADVVQVFTLPREEFSFEEGRTQSCALNEFTQPLPSVKQNGSTSFATEIGGDSNTETVPTNGELNERSDFITAHDATFATSKEDVAKTMKETSRVVDDVSFIDSVESMDSIISSNWDPNDDSGSEAPQNRRNNEISDSLSENYASFYQHVSFLKWAHRAQCILYPADEITSQSDLGLGSLSEDSTDDFDEFGFRIVTHSCCSFT